MITTTEMPILDTSPRGLADALDTLVRQIVDHDREVAAVLAVATGQLRALAWNRFARRTTRRSMARALRRRHQRRDCTE
jgi:hypothetical protein